MVDIPMMFTIFRKKNGENKINEILSPKHSFCVYPSMILNIPAIFIVRRPFFFFF
jgi:hypothetical protein